MVRPGLLVVTLVLAGLLPLAGCFGDRGGDDAGDVPADAIEFTGTSVFPGTYAKGDGWSRVLEPGPYGIAEPTIERLVSAYDGVDILFELIRPEVPHGVKVPVIVTATPYLGPITVEDAKQEAYYDQLVPNYVPHGYAVVLLPVRGTTDQGGCMDLMGNAERADLDQAVTWLGTQEWSNGNVGMVGVSYDGSTPWEVAAMGNPHLKTIVPESGVNDLWSISYHNGSVQWFGEGGLVAVYYLNAPQSSAAGYRSQDHLAEGVVCQESWKGMASSAWSHAFVSRDEPTGFFAERNMRPDVLANYQGSVFWVHGLRDFRVDPLQGYEMIRMIEEQRPDIPVKMLLGQWDHGWPDQVAYHPDAVYEYARWDWAEILLHWFDHELKGLDVDVGPRIQVEDSMRGWRDEEEWPPADAVPTRFYLTPSGALATEADAASSDILVGADPNDDSTQYLTEIVACLQVPCPGPMPRTNVPCETCPAFETEPFDEEVRIAGLPRLDLVATPTGPSGHIAAFLYMVRDGEAVRIGRGQTDLRLADPGDSPEPVVPGQPLALQVQFQPMDAALPAGSSLRLVLTQGSYEERLPTVPSFPVRIGVGSDGAVLTALTFERDADDLFTKP